MCPKKLIEREKKTHRNVEKLPNVEFSFSIFSNVHNDLKN